MSVGAWYTSNFKIDWKLPKILALFVLLVWSLFWAFKAGNYFVARYHQPDGRPEVVGKEIHSKTAARPDLPMPQYVVTLKYVTGYQYAFLVDEELYNSVSIGDVVKVSDNCKQITSVRTVYTYSPIYNPARMLRDAD